MKTPKERLRAKTIIDADTGCWLWQASIMKRNGYGQFYLNGLNMTAHRASYILHKGEIPPGAWVLHTCDVKTCVNPSHLYIGDRQANSHDARARGQTARGHKHGMAKLTEQEAIAICQDPRYAQEIAKDTSVSITMIRLIKNEKSWTHLETFRINRKKKRPKGENCHLAKLTEAQVREILADDRTHKVIARDFNVSRSLISMIKTKKIWAHVKGENYANSFRAGLL